MSASEHEVEVASDAAFERKLQQLLGGEAARLGDEVDTDRAAAQQVVQRFRGHQRRNRVMVVAATVVSLAAAVALTLRLRGPRAALDTAARPANASGYALQSGAAGTPAGRPFALGQPLEAGTVVLLGAGACIGGKGERVCARLPLGAVVTLPRASEQVVTLLRGGVSVTTQSGVSVATIHGRVVAVTSALFTVNFDRFQPAMLVAVQSGSVRYHDPQGVESALFEGQSVRLPVPPASESVAPAAPAAAAEIAPSSAPLHVAPPASAPSVASATDLLELARQERAARRYSAAAVAYRKLEQSFPGSAEARAALVSLGQLQLGPLGQPEAALRSFRAYLAAPGQLQQEAEHGRILALQKLGRKAEERRAIDAFLARYPKSVQAGTLKERLKQL